MIRQALTFKRKNAKRYAKATACAFGLFLSACEQPSPPSDTATKPQSHTLRRAIYSAHFQFDPHLIKTAADAAPLRDLYVGLTRFNATGQIVPALAEKWLTEDDGKTWLFALDQKAKWSNGESVRAQDFVASWQRLATPENASPFAKYLHYMGVENALEISRGEQPGSALGVVAENDWLLKITLNRANYQLPKMLAHIALLPTYRGERYQEGIPITNGDYRILTQQNDRLLLGANRSALNFSQVEYALIRSNQATDSWDIVENPRTPESNILTLPRLCSYFYQFNFADPQLKKREVRQAIRSMWLSAQNDNNPENSYAFILPPGLASPPNRHYLNTPIEQLLGKAGIRSKNPLHLTLSYNEGEQHAQIAEELARALGQSDLFRIRLQPLEWAELQRHRLTQDYQLIRGGWCADYPDALAFLLPYHSQSPDNHSGYHNPHVDSLLERLYQEELSDEARDVLLQNVLQQLENDVVLLPVQQYQRKIKVAADIQGIDSGNFSEIIYSKDLSRQIKDNQ